MSLKSAFRMAAALTAATFLTGCLDSGPDYGPIGDGLKAIGICMVVAAVVAALADLIKSEQGEEKPPEPKPQQNRQTSNRKEEQK